MEYNMPKPSTVEQKITIDIDPNKFKPIIDKGKKVVSKAKDYVVETNQTFKKNHPTLHKVLKVGLGILLCMLSPLAGVIGFGVGLVGKALFPKQLEIGLNKAKELWSKLSTAGKVGVVVASGILFCAAPVFYKAVAAGSGIKLGTASVKPSDTIQPAKVTS